MYNTKQKLFVYFYLTSIVLGNNILVLISQYLLNKSNIFIFEQSQYTFNNNSLIYYLPFFFGYLIVSIIFISYFKINIKKSYKIFNEEKMNLSQNKYLVYFVTILLLLSYINIILTGDIPVISKGYISRFDYLESTRLWFVLKFFGQTITIIPIILGYLLLLDKTKSQSNKFIYFLFFFYLVYIILIGQKFGGIIQGVFIVSIPCIVNTILEGRLKINKFFMYSIVLVLVVFSLVYYHYSRYTLTYQYGGPIQFILYRIFYLQGHTFWGTVNHVDDRLNLMFWYNGMSNIMGLIGSSGIGDAIQRGVNFSGGFEAVLLKTFPIIIAYIISFIIYLVFILLIKLIVSNLFSLKYIVYCYIFIYFYSFLSIGSLNILLNIKIAILLILLLYISLYESKLYNLYIRYKNKNY